MKTTALLSLALLPLSAPLATAQQPEAPAPAASAPATQPSGVASLSDAECLAIVQHIQTVQRDVFLPIATSYETDDETEDAILALAALPQPPENLPEDFRSYITEFRSITQRLVDALKALEAEEQELRYSDGDNRARRRELRQTARKLEEELKAEFEAMKTRYPRAAILGERWFFAPAEESCNDFDEPSEEVKRFMREHPELRRVSEGKAQGAWLRHCAAQIKPEELTAEKARHLLVRMELLAQLRSPNWDDSDYESGIVGEDRRPRPLILPSAPSTGYRWKLAAPLGEDALVALEWLHVPTAELRKLQQYGIISSYRELPDSEETCIVALHLKKPGKMTLRFVLTHPDDTTPLLTKTVKIEIEAEDSDSFEDED